MANQPVKKLIVAVDLSDYSKVVVKQAQELGRLFGAELNYVYALQNVAKVSKSNKMQVTAYYEKAVREKYRLEPHDKVILRYGLPFEEIIAVAEGEPASMIVAGHRGYSPLKRFFIGSTAERLALLSRRPVWIVRGKSSALPQKILLPVDLSKRSDRAVAMMDQLNESLKAKTELLHIMEEPMPMLDFQAYALMYKEARRSDEKAIRDFRKKHPSLKVIKATGGAEYRIGEHAKDCDLIVMTPKDHRNSSLFTGSLTAKILRSGEKSVLVIP